jgi:prophage regulatory protein
MTPNSGPRLWPPTSGPQLRPQVPHSVGRVDKEDIRLMGMAEIADRLKLGRDRANVLANRRDFPLPIARLKMGQVWLAGDVDAWVREHRPHLDEPDEA